MTRYKMWTVIERSLFLGMVVSGLVLFVSVVFGEPYTATWDANTEADLERYEMYQIGVDGVRTPVVSIQAPSTTIGVDVPPGEDKTYVLTAVDGSGNESEECDPVVVDVAPVKPCGLLFTKGGG